MSTTRRTCLSKFSTKGSASMGTASGLEDGCFRKNKKSFGRTLSGWQMPPTKGTTTVLVVAKVPTPPPKKAEMDIKMLNDTENVQEECGIRLLLGSTSRAKYHSANNYRWSAPDHRIGGEKIHIPQNEDKNAPLVRGRLQTTISHPPDNKNIPGAQTFHEAQKTGHHPAEVHSQLATKMPKACKVVGVKTQARTPCPA